MNITRVLAIAQRIMRQFKHDKRTLGMLFIVPIIVISILGPLLSTDPTFKIGVINNDKAFTPQINRKIMPLIKIKTIPKPKPIKASTDIVDSLNDQTRTSIIKINKEKKSRLLKNGDIIAVITFSSDFSENLVKRKKMKINVEIDGSNPARSQAALMKISQALAGQNKASKPNIDVDYKYGGSDFDTLDYTAPSFIAFFAFFFVFLLTSVSFLRERGQGTIERLMSSPASRFEIILGYLIGFILFATIQVAVIMLYTIYALKVHYAGNIAAIYLIVFLLTLVGVNMGIFFSSFAANELQVIQFIPIVITPQGLLSGLVVPVEDLPKFFQWLSQLMPLTHAINALQQIMLKGFSLASVAPDILFLIIFALLMLVLSTLTIKRRVA